MLKKNKTTIVLVSFFMVLGVIFLGFYYKTYFSQPKRLPTFDGGRPGHHIEAFSFINQDGKTMTEKDMEGKIYVAEYFFTTCKDMCVVMNENMTKVYQAYRGDKDVAILSHTVDPETDTVEQLKRFSLKYDADPAQWNFVTGDKTELYKMAINSYLVTALEDTTKKDVLPQFIHSEKFILVDKERHIRGIYDGRENAEIKQLIKDIKELKKEYAQP